MIPGGLGRPLILLALTSVLLNGDSVDRSVRVGNLGLNKACTGKFGGINVLYIYTVKNW